MYRIKFIHWRKIQSVWKLIQFAEFAEPNLVWRLYLFPPFHNYDPNENMQMFFRSIVNMCGAPMDQSATKKESYSQTSLSSV